MVLEHREQGETRQEILGLLRQNGSMTAAELSSALGIGAVGVRQHLALLERDNLVRIADVRRGIGRPSHLYSLTEDAEQLFPKRYDKIALETLEFVELLGGDEAINRLFAYRRSKLEKQYAPQLADKTPRERVFALAEILNEQGYMCEVSQEPDGSVILTEHNCPIDCVARSYQQICSHELTLYESLIGTPMIREQNITEDDTCCRYRIPASAL